MANSLGLRRRQDEDRSQVRTGKGPRIMASLRDLAIAILRLAGHPECLSLT